MGKQRDKRPVRKAAVKKADSVLDVMYDPEPTFVNNEGTKWFLNKPLTRYAQKEDRRGVALKANVFRAETKAGHVALVMVIGNKIVSESTTYEEMSFEIDVLKLVIHHKTEN